MSRRYAPGHPIFSKPCVKCGVVDRNQSANCRPCGHAQVAQYRREHKEHIARAAAAWRQKNKASIALRTQAYRDQNREKVRGWMQAWKEANRSRIREAQRELLARAAPQRREANKLRHKVNKERYAENVRNRPCLRCGATDRNGWGTCNPCGRQSSRAYYHAHPTECLAKVKAWAVANPERRRDTRKAWERANPEKVAEHRRTYPARKYHHQRLAELRFWLASVNQQRKEINT